MNICGGSSLKNKEKEKPKIRVLYLLDEYFFTKRVADDGITMAGGTINYHGREYLQATVDTVAAGDFIRVRGERGMNKLVEIVTISRENNPETGRLKSWMVEGRDGKSYGMYTIIHYLKRADAKTKP